MQEHDFGRVEDVKDFQSIPAGEYTVRVAHVREGVTREGSERWAMQLVVSDGDYAGRTAAWDALIWSEKGLPRAKFVLAQLGFDVEGRLALEAQDLIDREAHVRLVTQESFDELSQRTIVRLKVPYTGYSRAANGAPF
jgi:hypothetical protein